MQEYWSGLSFPSQRDLPHPGIEPASLASPVFAGGFFTLGEGNGNPLQYSCMENPMDRAAWQAIVHGIAKSRTRLSDFTIFTSSATWEE